MGTTKQKHEIQSAYQYATVTYVKPWSHIADSNGPNHRHLLLDSGSETRALTQSLLVVVRTDEKTAMLLKYSKVNIRAAQLRWAKMRCAKQKHTIKPLNLEQFKTIPEQSKTMY